MSKHAAMARSASPDHLARRAFLRRAGQLGLAGVAAPWALNLAAIGEAAAFSANDYKALVCVFLYGGNDYGNTLVPYDNTNYARYAAIRTGIATSQASLAATALSPAAALPGGLQLALAPQMTGLKNLFDAGKLAVQLNVGPLIQPTTLAQYNARSVPLPPKLFSHNDQQSVWQSSRPEGSTAGWGGKLGDLALSSNSSAVFTCISVTGNAVYLAGQTAAQYQVSTSGAVAINGIKSGVYGSSACGAALNTLLTQASTQALEHEVGRVAARSITAESQVSSALAGTPAFTTTFPAGNTLASQLQLVARLIAARSSLGAKRQVFMVSLGGFDLHDNLVAQHPTLLGNVSRLLATRCVDGITANEERCLQYVRNSIGVVTALNPIIGYKNSTKIAKEALETGRGVYELVLEHGILNRDELDEVLRPENMIHPVKLAIKPRR